MTPHRLCLLLAAAVALSALRIGGNVSPAFQAVAHVYVGGLIGAWLAGQGRGYFWLAAALSALEVGCAIWFRLFARPG